MQSQLYLAHGRGRGRRRLPIRKRVLTVGAVLLLTLIGFFVYKQFLAPTTPQQAADRLSFDDSVTTPEKQAIQAAIRDQSKTYRGSVNVRAETSLVLKADTNSRHTLAVYVPVANVYAVRQAVSKSELSQIEVFVPKNTDSKVRAALAKTLSIGTEQLKTLTSPIKDLADSAVAFVPVSELSPRLKLLALDDSYYLDSFTSGAVFRSAVFGGGGAGGMNDLKLHDYPTKSDTLKVTMSGVTALTRDMIKKLQSVGDATHFSEKIGSFLADADITHVSNEVSFKPGCGYSTGLLFCSPPEMIEALKASGVDVVELTGNHNNDVGSQFNTDTINQYRELGWATFGGGLNAAEAAKPFIADKKGSKVAFLGYNYPDAPGGAVATDSMAGANGFDAAKVESDITSAKQQADFVIVDIQFWECYSYPDGYVEFPECDVPIGQQTSVFRQIADAGADMVIGTQAHQPQTFELYNDTPIYYGLGNLYFDQTRWPGTERGIILTHYFASGKLLQTKLSPTVYKSELQTQLMNDVAAEYLLQRLKTARETAGL